MSRLPFLIWALHDWHGVWNEKPVSEQEWGHLVGFMLTFTGWYPHVLDDEEPHLATMLPPEWETP